MTITCLICKKESIPGDKTRSFHKFPAKDDFKQKWMTAIGLFSILGYERICSDHFELSSFHECNGYNIHSRRLLQNAIPSLNLERKVLPTVQNKNIACNTLKLGHRTNILENIYTFNESSNRKSVETLEISIHKTGPPQNMASDNISTHQILETSMSESSLDLNSSNQSSNRKRKDSSSDDKCLIPKKKIRYKDGFKTKYICREDFVSDKAWNNFMNYHILVGRHAHALRQRLFRKQKPIHILYKTAC